MSQKITRKDLIIQKYNILLNNIKDYTNELIFPSLDDYEIYELVYFFNIYFTEDDKDYTNKIKEIIRGKELNISDDTFNIIYPFIKEFLDFFQEVKKL
jgi:hypothetical protein